MLDEKKNAAPPHDSPDVSPRQFRIIDLFAVLTLAALISAMAAPFVRVMQPDKRNMLFIAAACQALVTVGTMVFAAHQRRQLLDRTGARIGIGYCGGVRWRHWPVFLSILSMVMLATAQLGLALPIAFLWTGDAKSPQFLVFQLQLGFFTGQAMSRYLWRVYPNAMEFFENGLVSGATSFVEWEKVEVRLSQFFSDRVVLVIRADRDSMAGATTIVQVSDDLRSTLLERRPSPGDE